MEQVQTRMESLSLAPPEIVEPRPSWLEVKDGFDWCSLCRLFATDAHLKSERHLRRAMWYTCVSNDAYAWTDPSQGPPQSWGHPDQFEWRGGWWWCRVCSQWADGCHVQGKRHQWRAPWADWYKALYDDDRRCNAITYDKAPQVPMLEAGTKHSEENAGVARKDDPWGPDWEASVKGHENKASRVETVDRGTCRRRPAPCNAASWEAWRPTTEARSKQRPDADVASDWRRTWSAEHQRSYFWHVDTGERRWDLPAGVSTDSDVEWCPVTP